MTPDGALVLSGSWFLTWRLGTVDTGCFISGVWLSKTGTESKNVNSAVLSENAKYTVLMWVK